MMSKKLVIAVLIVAFGATAAWAQGRFEITPYVGYRTSGSLGGGQNGYTDFHIEDGLAYGVGIGYLINPMLTMEVRWARSDSSVTSHGLTFAKTKVAEVSTDYFHANFIFYFRPEGFSLRPYLVTGLGAVVVNPKNVTIGETPVNPSTESRFSWNLGLGLQARAGSRVSFRLQALWLPVYINSTMGWWFDWWGYPWAVPISNYMHQFEFMGGLTFRF